MSLFNFILWLLWIIIVVIILGGAIYLFVGGSVLFDKDRSEPIVIYRQISDDSFVSITGSILMPTRCHNLHIDSIGDANIMTLQLEFNRLSDCDDEGELGLPETFFTEFKGGENTKINLTVNGINKEIIIK